MGDYVFRVFSAFLGSELLPASLRTPIMRAARFDIASDSTIWAKASFRSKKVRIGSGVFINIGFYHDGNEMLEIGDNVRVGPFVRVITGTHEIGPSHQRCGGELVSKPVSIGDGCWIGSGVTILPGVTVERGCVIAANALVHKSTVPDGLYAGIPARRVRVLEEQFPLTLATPTWGSRVTSARILPRSASKRTAAS